VTEEQEKNPYEGIIISGDSLDRELLARIVAPHIQIYVNRDEPEILFKSDDLTVREKILVFLLGRKILKDTDKLAKDEEEGMTPSQLEAKTHISGNTIRPQLRTLLQSRLVQKNDSRYFVPNFALINVQKELNKE